MSAHQKDPKLHQLVTAALFAAAITVMTAYFLHIPIPTGGYVHLGDTLIYLAACLLPAPYAMAASAVGAGLADLLTAPVWVVPTVLIKALLVFFFTGRESRILCRRNFIAVFLAGAFSPAAYALAGCVIAGNMGVFFPQLLGTLAQGIGSGALFLAVAPALDGMKLKTRLAL